MEPIASGRIHGDTTHELSTRKHEVNPYLEIACAGDLEIRSSCVQLPHNMAT
jgi:hypothetical protein